MIDTELSYFDAAVLGVMLLSCIFAFFRGFAKEILSLGAWIGAGLVTLYWFRDVGDAFAPHFENPMIAGGLAALVLYVSALLAFSLVNSLIMRMIRDGGEIGILDNSLGLLFGAFRGAFIVSLGYLVMTVAMTKDNQPYWLKNAKTKEAVEKGAVIVGRIAPEYLIEHSFLKTEILAANGVQAADEPDLSDAEPAGLNDLKTLNEDDIAPVYLNDNYN